MGYVLPLMMIYPRKHAVPDKLKVGAVANTMFHNSESGWINGDLYLEWLDFLFRTFFQQDQYC